jgi:hypothetical protein
MKAFLLGAGERVPTAAVSRCIALALTHHRRK